MIPLALDRISVASPPTERFVGFYRAGGHAIDLVVYPNAYHAFSDSKFESGRRYFGHWLKYDDTAAADALARVRKFLDRRLAAEPGRQLFSRATVCRLLARTVIGDYLLKGPVPTAELTRCDVSLRGRPPCR